MLARVAQTLYWIARDLERAESFARLLEVGQAAALEGDSSNGAGGGLVWEPLVRITGDLDSFLETHRRADERSVPWFLTSAATTATASSPAPTAPGRTPAACATACRPTSIRSAGASVALRTSSSGWSSRRCSATRPGSSCGSGGSSSAPSARRGSCRRGMRPRSGTLSTTWATRSTCTGGGPCSATRPRARRTCGSTARRSRPSRSAASCCSTRASPARWRSPSAGSSRPSRDLIAADAMAPNPAPLVLARTPRDMADAAARRPWSGAEVGDLIERLLARCTSIDTALGEACFIATPAPSARASTRSASRRWAPAASESSGRTCASTPAPSWWGTPTRPATACSGSSSPIPTGCWWWSPRRSS